MYPDVVWFYQAHRQTERQAAADSAVSDNDLAHTDPEQLWQLQSGGNFEAPCHQCLCGVEQAELCDYQSGH
ncbi:hypothetical protein D3C87_1926840 [compost metagenome]